MFIERSWSRCAVLSRILDPEYSVTRLVPITWRTKTNWNHGLNMIPLLKVSESRVCQTVFNTKISLGSCDCLLNIVISSVNDGDIDSWESSRQRKMHAIVFQGHGFLLIYYQFLLPMSSHLPSKWFNNVHLTPATWRKSFFSCYFKWFAAQFSNSV